MRCAWKELLSILPPGIRSEVDAAGKDSMKELRLRINAPPELILSKRTERLSINTTVEDINFVVNAATQYSPWTASSAAHGYITAPGGHRIGLCGEVIYKNGILSGMRTVRSVCIRVARDFPGIAKTAAKLDSSILILGAPGTGKTTLLRDLSRQISLRREVCVVDERYELFPEGVDQGRMMDILLGAPKKLGIEMVLRTMSPEYIAIDEITAEEDCAALIRTSYCGVKLLATAHAGCLEDFSRRGVYRQLLHENIFDTVLVLDKDQHFTQERMKTR